MGGTNTAGTTTATTNSGPSSATATFNNASAAAPSSPTPTANSAALTQETEQQRSISIVSSLLGQPVAADAQLVANVSPLPPLLTNDSLNLQSLQNVEQSITAVSNHDPTVSPHLQHPQVLAYDEMTAITMERYWGMNISELGPSQSVERQRSVGMQKQKIFAEYEKEKLEKAASKLDKYGNIIPETDEELKVMVERLEQDQYSLYGWQSYTEVDDKLRGDKIELLKEGKQLSKEGYNDAVESIRIQEEISKKIVHQFEQFLQFFSIETDIQIHNGNIVGLVTEQANNVVFIDQDKTKTKMNYMERKHFSRLMLDNLIAAYETSQLDIMLVANFSMSDDLDWQYQLKMMQYLKIKFDYYDELNFNADWFLQSFIKSREDKETLVKINYLESIDEIAQKMTGKNTLDSDSEQGQANQQPRRSIYQDLQERYMSEAERKFKKDLEAQGVPVEQIYAIFYDYKSQQLSFALQNIQAEEYELGENYVNFMN